MSTYLNVVIIGMDYSKQHEMALIIMHDSFCLDSWRIDIYQSSIEYKKKKARILFGSFLESILYIHNFILQGVSFYNHIRLCLKIKHSKKIVLYILILSQPGLYLIHNIYFQYVI